MIVPCIDLQGGRAVQLVHGRRLALAVDDVFGLLERFRRYRYLHVIDLDAAIGGGSNVALVRALCRRAARGFGLRVRVGGGIRTVARAERILGWGAEKVIIGTAAFRSGQVNTIFLERLIHRVGRQRVMLALDAERGRLVVRGWRQRLRLRPEQVLAQLEPYCSEFLCTCVDREGRLRGTNLAWFRALRRLTTLPITAAGGICSRTEIRALARLGIKSAVGMALYTGRLR
jgi:phosphoribosylformimino-5-aminoimidazole carboxamide ribonucleotide (ProFAR) isomerase